ncbi:MAG: VWA domain-containing protein [Bacteroidetes bacterium]|nr:VWA domain-containing protein [Bacteroidota bacterium]
MRRLLPLFLFAFIVLSPLLQAQPWNEIRILHVNTDNFPAVHVKVRAFCAGQQSTDINPVTVRILENGFPRSMVSFNCPTQTEAISVALVLDRSGSVAGTSFFRMKAGAKRFVELFRDHGNALDEGAIFSFGDNVVRHVGMTTNIPALFDAIDQVYPYGLTTLYDAIIEALNEVAQNGSNQIKGVVVFSDGGDNNSFASLPDVIAHARTLNIPIYSIGVAYELNEVELGYMRMLADSTGGRFIGLEHPEDIIPAFNAMASLVSNGANDCDMLYYSDCADGSWRELTVIAEACGLADTMHVGFRVPIDPNLPAFKVSFDSTYAYENGDLHLPVMLDTEGGGGTLNNIRFKVLEQPPLRFAGIVTEGMLGESMQIDYSIAADTLFVEATGPVFVSGPTPLLKIRYTTPSVSEDTSFVYPVFFLDKRTQDCMRLLVRNNRLAILKRPELGLLCGDSLNVEWDAENGRFVDDEVTIGVTVRNTGTTMVENARVQLRVPDGMELLSAADFVMLPENPLPPGALGYTEFTLRVLPDKEKKIYELCLEVQADSGLTTTCCRTIIVEAAQTLLETTCSMPDHVEWIDSLGRYSPERFPVRVEVRNSSELSAEEIEAWIHVPPGFVLEPESPQNTFVTPSPFGKEDVGTVIWWVRPLERPTSELLRFCIKVAAGTDTVECCQDVFITAAPVRAQLFCDETRIMVYDDGTGEYDPPRLLITTTVHNISTIPMTNTRGRVRLPDFVNVDAGDFTTKDFPNSGVIPPGESATINWVVLADGYPSLPAEICVVITAENYPGAECCTSLDIEMVNAIPGLQCALSGRDTIRYINGSYVPNPMELNLTVQNTGNTPGKQVYAALLQGEDFSIDAGDQALKLIADSLGAGDEVTTSFRIRILDRSVSRYDTIRVTVYAENGGAVTCMIPVYIEAVRGPVLDLSCSGPDSLTFADGLNMYQPDPFRIELSATNIGTATADSVVAEFLPPPGILLAQGETAAKLLDPSSLAVGQSGVAQWMLHAIPRSEARIDTIRVQVKARGKTMQQTAPCDIPVFIPATRLANLDLTCLVVREAVDNDTVIVAAGLMNTGDATAYDVKVRVQFPSKLRLDPADQDLEQTVAVLEPGSEVQLFPWRFSLTRGAVLDSVDVCFIAEARHVPPTTCCTSVRIPPSDHAAYTLDCAIAPDTVRVDAETGEYDEVLFEATLTNPTAVSLDSVRCTIVLPSGVILANGETDEKIVHDLLPAGTRRVAWRLLVLRDTATVYRASDIRVDAVGLGVTQRCSRTLIIAPPPQLPTDFIISCTAPDSLIYDRATSSYTPAPFMIHVDIINTGSTSLTNVRATLTPAAQLALEAGETLTKTLDADLPPGQQTRVSWSLRGAPQPATTIARSAIRVEADGAVARNCEPVTLLYHPPVNDTLAAELTCTAPNFIPYQGRGNGWQPSPFSLVLQLRNTGTLLIESARATLLLPEGFTLENGEQPVKDIPSHVLPGETVAVTWNVRVMAAGSPDPCFKVMVTVPGLETLECVTCVQVEEPYDYIQMSIPDNNVGMMGQTVDVPIQLLNQLALPLRDMTIAVSYDTQLLEINEIEQRGTLTDGWPAIVVDHPEEGIIRLRLTGDTPLLESGVLLLLRCRLLQLGGYQGSFGVFQSNLNFEGDWFRLEPGIVASLKSGFMTISGDCIVPLDGTDALTLRNTPNPFNPVTVIEWQIPPSFDGVEGTLTVLDMYGRELARLHEGVLRAGTHQSMFDATGLPSGMYLYRLRVQDRVMTRKMMLAK